MNNPKVPDNQSDWKSLDIYVFSNGQRSSPPRKYHLMVDQLEWWKATLHFLAKSQYGSLHSIVDLYSIEGNKVETPMQLSQNTAYVAVLPTDLFIDAGYGKYLIKATRSWEKGQFRRTSNTAVLQPEDLQMVNEKPNNDNEAAESPKSNKKQEDSNEKLDDGSVILNTIIASMVDNNQPSVIVKPAAKDKPFSYSEKHRPSVQHTSKLRRNSILPSPPRSRKPSLKIKDADKVSPDLSKLPSITISNPKYPLKSRINKPVQKQKVNPEKVLKKVAEVVSDIKSNSSILNTDTKNAEANITETNLEMENNEIIIAKHDNNAEIEKLITVHLDPLSDAVNRQDGEHDLVHDTYRSFESTNIERNMNKETDLNVTKDFNTIDLPFDELKISSTNVSKSIKTDNEVAESNNERVLNMKLNIEVWSSPNEAKPVQTVMHKKDSMIILKVEKGSQVELEDKPLHYKLITNDKNDNVENNKLIIVNCANGSDETKNITTIKHGSTNYVFFFPILKLNEDYKSCNNNCESKEDKGTNCCNASSILYPPKKTISCLSLHKERVENIYNHSELASRNNSTEIHVERKVVHDKNEVALTKRKSVAIKEEQEMLPFKTMALISRSENHHKVIAASDVNPDKSDVYVIKRESIASILHKCSSKLTQTEWCDVLLEVKLQEDGHYSFHMPTLEMLKHYKL